MTRRALLLVALLGVGCAAPRGVADEGPAAPGAASAPAADLTTLRDVPERVDDLKRLEISVQAIRPGIFKIEGQGAAFVVNTSDGSLLVDTGFDNESAVQQKARIDEIAAKPLRRIVLTHAHQDHSGGIRLYDAERAAGAELITHERYRYMSRHQLEPLAYFKRRYKRIYPELVRTDPSVDRSYWQLEPDREVPTGQRYAFTQGDTRFEVIAPRNGGEGEDGLLVWLPEPRVLFVGDLFGTLYPMFPNLYTVRGEKVRDPLDYIDALDLVLELDPEVLVLGHFHVIDGNAAIRASVRKMRDAVQYVWDETVAAMNAGKTVWQAMDEIALPEHLALSQGHGKVSWTVRATWELLTGWYHGDSVANLYAVPHEAVHADLVELAGGADALVARARAHFEAGRNLAALRLLDVAAAAGDAPAVLRLRIEVLERLRERAVRGLNNYSEVSYLAAEIREAREKLGAD